MSKLMLLFITVLFSTLFLIIPDTTEAIDYFPFSEMKLYFKTYLYYAFEKLIVIALAYIIASEETKYKQEVQIFFWLMVADLIDYLLTYSWVWFRVGAFPVSMNVAKAFVFGFVILRTWIRQKH